MATIAGPRSQAGIISFYDAPEKGYLFNQRIFLIAVLGFAIIIVGSDRFLPPVPLFLAILAVYAVVIGILMVFVK